VPCSDNKNASANIDRVFKRTSAGVWSSVTSGRDFQNGGVAVMT
jgi:hypothetical protein